MNNLKKVLALSLAATSVLGTVSFASFNDQQDIVSTDAVDTLVALNILKGYEDGTFRPKEDVSRAEMAKIIYTVKNGGSDDASAFNGINSSFTDITGHWAEGYIKYCQAQGIIDGKSNTSFDPDSNVTGTEALKMSLVLLGYKSDISDLTGSDWDINTLALSIENDLTDNYIGTFHSSAQRQSAAQIVYNALYTETVRYSTIYDDYIKSEKTLAETALNLETIENVYIKDSDIKTGLSFTTNSSLETADDNSPLNTDRDFSHLIGQKVDILADTKKDAVYGVRVHSDNKVINTFAKNITISGLESNKQATFSDIKINLDDEQAESILNANVNDMITIVYNGDVTTVSINPVVVGKVTFVNSEKINVSVAGFTSGQLTFDGDNIYSKIAKEDFVQISYDDFNNQHIITQIELQNGTVDATRNNEFRVDGEWFTLSDSDISLSLGSEISYFAVGSVLYNIGVAKSVSEDFAFVVATEVGSGLVAQNKAQVIFADGSKKIIVTTNDETDKIGTLVSYDSNSDDEYEFFEISSDDFDVASVSGNIFDDSKLAGSYVDDNALVFISYEDDKYTTVSGKDINSWGDVLVSATTENATLFTNVTNGISYVELAFIDLGSLKLPNEVGTETYGYVTDDPYNVSIDGTDYVVVSLFDGQDNITINAEKASNVSKGDFVTYELNSDGKTASLVTSLEASFDKVTGYNKSTGDIIFDLALSAKITDDTTIIYVDSQDIQGVESGSIVLADDMTGDGEKENNVKVLVEDGKVVVLFVDVNNNMQ